MTLMSRVRKLFRRERKPAPPEPVPLIFATEADEIEYMLAQKRTSMCLGCRTFNGVHAIGCKYGPASPVCTWCDGFGKYYGVTCIWCGGFVHPTRR